MTYDDYVTLTNDPKRTPMGLLGPLGGIQVYRVTASCPTRPTPPRQRTKSAEELRCERRLEAYRQDAERDRDLQLERHRKMAELDTDVAVERLRARIRRERSAQ